MKRSALSGLMLAGIFLAGGLPPWIAGAAESPDRPVAVIDPGHGGSDAGAVGMSGTREKSAVLALARMVAATLKNTCSVALTREDDYAVEIFERTEKANRLQAAVFVSLHTGASFSRQPSGTAVYFYSPYSPGASELAGMPGDQPQQGPEPIGWRHAQLPHRHSSERLAQSVCAQMSGVEGSSACTVDGAGLLVLEGAAMPAVLIEIGTITNPTDEKLMLRPEHQAALAAAISRAVSGFLAAAGSQ